jgi:CRP-like cAMP-binding protein/ActR/RegA family two-component response regulator
MEAKPRILVLEDNYLTAEALCDLVRAAGCDVVGSVGHVRSAVEFVHSREIDGAIVDINLHGDPSFPVCAELKRLKVPFVFLSGYDRSRIPSAFTDYKLLSKPVEQDQLKLALAEFAATDAAHEGATVWLGNALLDKLTPPTLRTLQPLLERIPLKPGRVLQAARAAVSHVYFPTDGLVTLFAHDTRGRRLAVGMVGRDGMVGANESLCDAAPAFIEAVVELSGEAWRIDAGQLAPLLRNHVDLRANLLDHVRAELEEIAQTAIVTGYGTLEQRLARWLLIAATRAGCKQLPLTHEHLAQVLAVRRSGVTVALHTLEGIGAIKSHRQLVDIVDRAGLQRAANGFV